MPNELTPARRVAPFGQGLPLVLRTIPEARPVDARIGRVDVQARGQVPVFKSQHGLDDAGHACRGFGVPNIAFHRTDEARLRPIGMAADGRRERGQLDAVTGGGSGAVGFNILEVGG